MSDKLPPCRGLWGWLFGHIFEARYDTEVKGVPAAAPQLQETWRQALASYQSLLDNVSSNIARSYQALGQTNKTYSQDVCVRCGLVVFAPPKRSVIVATPVVKEPPPPAPAPPPPPAPPPKVVVVQAPSPQHFQGVTQTPVQPNPVRATPHPRHI